jgi:MscS family membrane protein
MSGYNGELQANRPAGVLAWVKDTRWINLQILERFNEEGVDFAFPTQPLCVAGDEMQTLDIGV